MNTPRIGIVGAGLAGLMAGRILGRRGGRVSVFDKARRPGGRANTREHGSYRFDHGAQFFTVRDPRVRRLLPGWMDAGVVTEWKGSLVRIEEGSIGPAKEATRYVGTPGMIGLSAHLARDLEVDVGRRVVGVSNGPTGWRLETEAGDPRHGFDVVVLAVPAPQAAQLLSTVPKLRSRIEKIEMDPCWAGMYVFDGRLPVDYDGAFIADGPISWVARDSSKPGRPAGEAWVLHGSPAWSREHEAMDQEDAGKALLEAYEALSGTLPKVVFHRAHRWAFAQGHDRVAGGAIFDQALGIGACGDWCMGGRVEGALLSGIEIADQILPP